MIIELSDFFNNPSLIAVGNISIQYYAVTWILSAIFIYLYLANNSITKEIGISKEKANDLVFLYGLIFGAMIGGRVGYMLFYGFDQLINNPLKLFYIWEGGLSFHGGLIGVIISMFVFSKQNNINFMRLLDSAALSMPIGLCLVRIGNFLNGELYGRATESLRQKSQATLPFLLWANADANAVKNIVPSDVATQMCIRRSDS